MKRIFLLTGFMCFAMVTFSKKIKKDKNPGVHERAYLVSTLVKMADPVLVALSKNELKKTMPVEQVKGAGREKYTHLEAFGRLLSGMAPWLELGPDNTQEGKLRKKYIDLARICLFNATNPEGADYMNFSSSGQPVVDAAFLAEALLRAPKQLWEPLNEKTKSCVIDAIKKCDGISHAGNNWVMFTATMDAFLLKVTGKDDTAQTLKYVDKCLSFYKGDGIYGDGKDFHFDYYNSFVMQPMLLEVLSTLIEHDSINNIACQPIKDRYNLVLKRAQRYAEIEEMLINPTGTYTVMGRSSAYRFGAFQLLSKIARMQVLPEKVSPQQVRAALYTLIKTQIEAPGTFDKNGWLTIGVYGHQPTMGEFYISTGSLYLCSEAFLILGLPVTNTFWQGEDKDWTSKKIWSGQQTIHDHSIEF